MLRHKKEESNSSFLTWSDMNPGRLEMMTAWMTQYTIPFFLVSLPSTLIPSVLMTWREKRKGESRLVTNLKMCTWKLKHKVKQGIIGHVSRFPNLESIVSLDCIFRGSSLKSDFSSTSSHSVYLCFLFSQGTLETRSHQNLTLFSCPSIGHLQKLRSPRHVVRHESKW